MIDYPIKFRPILQDKIWGGSKLRDVLNKPTTRDRVGESWEISGVKGHISVVDNGSEAGKNLQELLEEYGAKLVGEKIYKQFGNDFPLLIKFIDAKTDLSVQLHPNDELAKQRHNSFGKTEMWFVMQADEGAKLNIGFNKSVEKREYLEHLENGKITDLLNFEEVSKGDSVFINTGKVHAIGAGVLLAEIQQTSDITYRIYDWDRVDDEGNSRELHTALAIDAIDFEKKDDYQLSYEKKENQSSEVASCEYFTTNYLPVNGEVQKDYSELDSFVIYMCVDGEVKIDAGKHSEILQKGESLLLPAILNDIKITGSGAELLEVFIA
ncbi:type I phosphomannose isomerase catalytic subunit [Christiangramia flava]|uniref:Phosphohexomutase n=1 Tax=Christiangramia flava JLT2011 TaxID=1229726 RepID=A0A1L7I902_9FLAO|nr:type I phosphomannose isomerase catalytic subunit [Christiangramia flava]APU70091.1 Mannose-6-phosphate isomerase [Christiangramia flava JLT2011]OSS39577.1 Mannose-6-phosphate isomerase [Christiangramia flava JLT2011]